MSSYDEYFEDNTNTKQYEHKKNSKFNWTLVGLIILFHLIISCIAAYLCWDCNKNVSLFLRLIVTAFSWMNSEIYIIYYAIYRIFMGNTCPI